MSLEKLRKAIKEEKIIYGTERTLKNLRLGKTKIVFLSENCPNLIKEKIKKYKTEIIELGETSEELALICKRPHSITVLSY